MIELTGPLRTALPTDPKTLFKTLLNWPGKIYSEGNGRITKEIKIADRLYFVKLHSGIGWLEILEHLIQGKLPILGARAEYLAIQHCHQIGIPTMTVAGFFQYGSNPATQKSFLITEALGETESLENLCKTWATQPPSYQFRCRLIITLANILRQFHGSGMNHCDCYLCHFRIPIKQIESHSMQPLTLYVMDLHRCQIRKQVPFRWLAKDLGSLLFSARNIGLSTRDQLRFIRIYSGTPLKQALADPIWQAVKRRCQRLTNKHG